MGAGLLDVPGHDDALAGGETVVLHDVRGAERVERLVDLRRVGAHVRAGGGHAGAGHDVLGERLGALQLGGLAGRAEDGDAGGADRIGDTGDQGCLGSDDNEVGLQLLGEDGDRRAVEGVDRVQLGDLGDTCVAGSTVQGGDVGVEGH